MHLERFESELALIPSGPPGIAATLRLMKQFAREGKTDTAVRVTAARLVQGCDQKDYACEVQTLHAFVRDQIRYLNDVDGVETVQTPFVTLQIRAGDCDDKSTLLAALLMSIGHPCRFQAIGFEPNVYAHVYVETKIGARWISLETTEPVEVGWEPNPKIVQARMVYWI